MAAGVGDFSIIGGKIGGDINLAGTGSQGRAILINTGASDNYRIIGVDLTGNQYGGLSDGGTGTAKKILGNIGADDSGITQGSITVSSGSSTGVLVHGLRGVPTHVQATPVSDTKGLGWWATRNATQVIVHLSAPAPANIEFNVDARI